MSELLPAGFDATAYVDAPRGYRVFLEIGSGPVPTAAETSRRFEGDDAYVSIELNNGVYHQDDMFERQKQSVADRRDVGHIALTQGDGRSTPLPRRSVHEVYMGNVMTAVIRRQQQQLLRESHRIMDGSGPLVLDVGYTTLSNFIPELQEDLQAAGFAVGGVHRERDDDQEPWRQLRGLYPSVWPGNHVFVVAEKLHVPSAVRRRKR